MIPEDNIPSNVAEWIVAEPPLERSPQLSSANCSPFEWRVFTTSDDANPSAELVKVDRFYEQSRRELPLPFPPPLPPSSRFREGPTEGRRYVKEVEDGYIIGFNKGEWGGSLWWCTKQGVYHHITRANVVGILHTNVGLLVLEGLAHLTSSSGQLLKIERDIEGRWVCKEFLKLYKAPRAATFLEDDSLLIVTSNGLVRVYLDERENSANLDKLLSDQFWRCLYPNSVVATRSGDIFIGMRHGVVRVAFNDDCRVDWLLPNQEFVEVLHEPKA
jgi:hypothetical protein